MDSIYKQHRPGSTNDLYLKLADGDKVKGRIASEPSISVYKYGDKPRYSWIMFVREVNGRTVNKPQILTKGISIYNGIADLVDEWGDIETFDIVIKRTGSGLSDTEYSVTPVRQSDELTDVQREEIKKIDLVQATKGKWLTNFIEDGELPAPVTDGGPSVPDEIVPMPSDDDAPINLDDIPGF